MSDKSLEAFISAWATALLEVRCLREPGLRNRLRTEVANQQFRTRFCRPDFFAMISLAFELQRGQT
jgi:hypothetical protein